MDLQAGLWQQQTLKLTMTQELKQAIEILQYSAQELSSFLETKALENPLIQLEHSNIKLMDPHFDYTKKSKFRKIEKDDRDWVQQIAKKSGSLQEYLLFQAHLKALTKTEKKVIYCLINSLDANGYLSIEKEELIETLGVDEEAISKGILFLQSLEPAGVGAQSLQECLLLQAKKEEKCPKLVFDILQNYFMEFAEKKWKIISKKLNVEIQKIQEAADFIQTLDPRPGSHFITEKPQYVLPDLIVMGNQNKLDVYLFEKHLPNVQFQKEYYTMMSAYKDVQVQQFLKDKNYDFQWLMKGLEQRKETLLKVGRSILQKQMDFFHKGKGYLKPMTMREVADDIGTHESTVSRAVREKYIQTPFGTFELKHFFSAALHSADETNASAVQVKDKIVQLIQQEDKIKPLSDQTIVEALQQEGITVSRRTVAKYRDQLNILPSSKRRRFI
ncbi:RNA polymerase sigma-54 factor [Heyndrickxia shackletonii]|uniref:RNA polymerase sigma-54 factor n=1 Tax=Heyndrickxia shackletonii TaxID=157838 RepID=A0A0Q3TGJ7_9BACI|nr:RNA polymerase factor sigma-54 [Heyndrickxia shackletonii]KQL53110.1 RNA polymerase sigma-54 factor [Heyndrickxia shackletonii]NEZ01884.1 RNA polymerase factor sigma-54 [Heyndrickxia shackletonii]